VVVLNSIEGHEIVGKARTSLGVGRWHHLAVVVRRSSYIDDGHGFHQVATAGEVLLLVDGDIDGSWPLPESRAHFGPSQARVFVIACDGNQVDGVLLSPGGGLSLSRVRVWARALLPGELGRCEDPTPPPAGGAEGMGAPGPRLEFMPLEDAGVSFGSPVADSDVVDRPVTQYREAGEALMFEDPYLSFSFQGSLAEAHSRATATPSGAWSMDIDAPPRCLGLTESPYDNLLEYCACYDQSLRETLIDAESKDEPYFWHSPQSYAAGVADADLRPFTRNRVRGEAGRSLNASTFLAVYRRFVNEPPRLHVLEPSSGLIRVFEDEPSYFSLQVTHKAKEQGIERAFVVTLRVSHGFVRTISSAAVVSISYDRRLIEYRAPLADLNAFLAQVEYVPDPNYNGEDTLQIGLTDLEFSLNNTIPIIVAPLSDPLVLVCPPSVDILEGVRDAPIGSNISILELDQLPGLSDADVMVLAYMFVGSGDIRLYTPSSPTAESRMDETAGAGGEEFMLWAGLGGLLNESAALTYLAPMIRLNATLRELRALLDVLTFTPTPVLFHGVVHFGLEVTVLETGEESNCDVGLVVHPMNSPPQIGIDEERLLAIMGPAGAMVPDYDVLLAGVLALSDPDEEDFYGWFTQRVHSARVAVRVSCGTLSLEIYGDSDYVLGVQSGSIAGAEGLTFHVGDGYKDPLLDITSTLDHLNGQLHRLYYHSYGCAGRNVTLEVDLDDLGNYGAGGAKRDHGEVVFEVSPR